ncbi:MAG TPA: protease pro-enzyme activation domain-containing protein, partial [bacterium]|nr:protease pro-enzyme activation domain-containing protein [bacterium]
MKRLAWTALLLGCAFFGTTAAAGPLDAAHARLLRAPLLGPLADGTVLTVNLTLPWRDQAGLDELLKNLYDPQSPQYRQFLDPDQFTARFGPSPADFQALKDFARANGLVVVAASPSRQYLQVQAPAGALRRALGATLNRRLRTDGTEFYASDEAPRFSLAGLDVQATGLDNFARPRFRHHPARPRAAGTRGGTALGPPSFPGSYMGYDFRDIYLPTAPASLIGSGQVIGLLEPEGFAVQDITVYEKMSNPPLPVKTPVVRKVDGATGGTDGNAGNIAEVCLDIEMAQAMAPGAQIKVYECPPSENFDTGCHDILTAMANDLPLCRQISCSWGGFGSVTYVDSLMLQFAAQGQSFFQASGDFGAFSISNTGSNNDQNPG